MLVVAAAGYAVLGLLYIILTALLLFSWRRNLIGGVLILVSAVSFAWAAVVGLDAVGSGMPDVLVFALEVIRAGLWVVFLSIVLHRLGVSNTVLTISNAVWLCVLAGGGGIWLLRQFRFFDFNIGTVLIPGGLLIALTGLMLIEQLLRNSPSETRWRIKSLAIALGGIFAYDLFLYSQALLFGAIDELTWSARGAVNAMFVPLIAIAARRNPRWDLDIFVSRQVVFYSTTLIAVGLYLLGMSFGGYLLLAYGGAFGGLAKIAFFVGAMLVLVTLLSSTSLRARYKVFLSKHFFRNKYDYREEWLRLIATLSGFEQNSSRKIVIKALAQIMGSPGGMLWVFSPSDKNYQFECAYDTVESAPDIPQSDAMIKFIRRQGWLIDLREYRQFPERYAGLDLPAWMQDFPSAWLVVPLIARGDLIGIVVLFEVTAPRSLNYEDRDLLKTAGHHIAVHLGQARSDSRLAEAQQFEAYNRLTAFLMHDLNNLIAQQSLIVKNAKRHKRNPDFVDDAMETIAGSVTRMKRVMEQLRTGAPAAGNKRTEVRFLVSAAVDRCGSKSPAPVIDLSEDEIYIETDGEQLVMVLSHLIGNAQDATMSDGQVEVAVRKQDGCAVITITDNGSGMTPEFIRQRLFRPFDSTKGSQGMGIGAYQAREFARRMQGDLQVSSEPGRGTCVTLTLPTVS